LPSSPPISTPASAHALVAELERTLTAGPGRHDRRPLPPDWRDDPVKVLIAMLLAAPDAPGAARALAWFYGRGLPSPTTPPPTDLPLDLATLLAEVLAHAVAADGLDTVRARFAAAFADASSPDGPRDD